VSLQEVVHSVWTENADAAKHVVACFEQEAETDHSSNISGLRSPLVQSKRPVILAGGVSRASKQRRVMALFGVRLHRPSAEINCSCAVLPQLIDFDTIDARGGVVRIGREISALLLFYDNLFSIINLTIRGVEAT
jgi:hypothetical protein